MEHSVTILIDQLRSDKNEEMQRAAADIWARYSAGLLELARRHLSTRVRRREDEEDVLQSMYKSFCQRHRDGQYKLGDRGDLWKLLVVMTENKARNTAIRHGRARRDVDREQAGGLDASDDSVPTTLAQLRDAQPTPAEAAELVEEAERRLAALEPSLRQVALWKLAGHTNEEIARMMNCVPRTVERKLERIRKIWERKAATPGPD